MRKVLSFVLVLALVLSSFSMAFAADAAAASLTDIAGNANEDAIKVCFDLGIVTGNPDGTFLPAKEVTRAEFAAMLTRALDIPASALAGYTSTSFKDTTGYSWAVSYLGFCQSKGILLGDGAGNVMPGKTISVNEAMTMALRAIGYTANSSLLVGAWPANYVSIAQNEDLYDDVAKTTSVTKASAAQIIYNLLTVQKVAVNTDGTTDKLWENKDKDKISNLLVTNLGCTVHEDEILGDYYDYDNTKINITDDIGAYGDAYTNSDGDLVAFTKHDCVELTGKVSDDRKSFEVGDVEYDFATNDFTGAALFVNATKMATESDKVSPGGIDLYATANADGGDTVTIWGDVSGKKIKDIYSISAWKASAKDLADEDVQDDIADKAILACDFAQTDDDVIDFNSFALVGVASLDKIAKDDVVYVYEAKDSDADIRKVAVGTETVEGAVTDVEMNDADTEASTVTIADKDYDVSALATSDAKKIDTDSEGKYYIDAYGEIYDFDGTNGVDTYAIVKGKSVGTTFDNMKLKIYKSDDSTSTYFLSEDDARKIDWTTPSGYVVTTEDAVSMHIGDLVGYSLSSAGEIDGLNVKTTSTNNATLQSSKVLMNGSTSVKIDSAVVVFTYDGTDYDIANIADIDANTTLANATYAAQYIMNDDNTKIVALFVNKGLAKVSSDDVYGVINTRATSTDADGDAVYKFTGFIDGTAFTYKTDDDDAGFKSYGKKMFGVYAFEVDSNNQITEIKTLATAYHSGSTYQSARLAAADTVSDLDDDNTVITTTSHGTFTAADNAVVYKYDTKDGVFSVSKLSAIDKGDTVTLYDTKDEDADGVATVVIYIEK